MINLIDASLPEIHSPILDSISSRDDVENRQDSIASAHTRKLFFDSHFNPVFFSMRVEFLGLVSFFSQFFLSRKLTKTKFFDLSLFGVIKFQSSKTKRTTQKQAKFLKRIYQATMISTRVLLAIALCLVALSSSEAKLRARGLKAKKTDPEVKKARRAKSSKSCKSSKKNREGCDDEPTEAPVAVPVDPTEAPVAPTDAPVAPTADPTAAPVDPTDAPVETEAPTTDPNATDEPETDAPTDGPTTFTSAPTESTTTSAPTLPFPTVSPTESPTDPPPTRAPVPRPTRRPPTRPPVSDGGGDDD